MHGNKVAVYCSTWVCDHCLEQEKGRRWERNGDFVGGVMVCSGRKQARVDFNRLQGGKQQTTEDSWRDRVERQTYFGVLPSQTKNFFYLSLFLVFSLYLSLYLPVPIAVQ